MGKLDAFSGPFTRRHAAHLLRRLSFGATNAQINQAVTDGLTKTINSLFAPLPTPPNPIDPATGVTWVGLPYDPMKGANYFNNITKNWWVELMINQPPSIREKLTLFWSNHFATEMIVVGQPQFSYDMHIYFRANYLKNFKTMAKDVTLMPAMLRYLNGNTNTKGSPNENYGRELQELFTIGKGPEISQGDYTTYTEQDVKAAARVLTGWRDDRLTGKTIFNPNKHDTADKQFSVRYQNTIVKGLNTAQAGDTELNAMLDMIFKQNATSEYLVTKFYRWFVSSEITETVITEIIQPLAQQLRNDGWVVEGVLRKLFASNHFYDAEVIGCQLRSPADFTIGLVRASSTFVPPTDASLKDRFYNFFVTNLSSQQMNLNDPNSVAGYEAYYQTPSYYRLWLTTATLPIRNGTSDAMLLNNNALNKQPVLSSPNFIKALGAEISDSYVLVRTLNEIFFASEFTEAQVNQLANEVLNDNQPDYTWTLNYSAWLAAQTPANFSLVRIMADRLLKYMFRMAEFQLG
ncbi:MAG: DUF1800 domain-containing protein [Ignavibacteria bacterium]|nr:DUF1800 domain-containing protein [Ignavibacteria bacterium]